MSNQDVQYEQEERVRIARKLGGEEHAAKVREAILTSRRTAIAQKSVDVREKMEKSERPHRTPPYADEW